MLSRSPRRIQTLLAFGAVAGFLVGCTEPSEPSAPEESSPNSAQIASDVPKETTEQNDLTSWMAMFENADHNKTLLQASGKLNLAVTGDDRDAILEFYVRMLKRDSLMVQSRAASGLQFAGLPTHPMAADALVDVVKHEVLMDDQRASSRGSAVGDRVDISLIQNATEALKLLGGSSQVSAIRKLAEYESRDYTNSISQSMVVELLDKLESQSSAEVKGGG